MSKILLVDDDIQSLDSTSKILEISGHTVVRALDGEDALRLVRLHTDLDLVISDIRMPKMDGLAFLKSMVAIGEKTPVVLMTAYGHIEDAVYAMKQGAVDFLTKPFKKQTLLSTVESALRARPLSKVRGQSSSERLIGASPAWQDLERALHQVAASSSSVLVIGESGVGKERVARQIHLESARRQLPFVALNCAAIPESLIESELFGHEKGAFSGATATKIGMFEAAHRGTLLLDEIGDMPWIAQAKLLRVLESKEVRRVGSTRSIPVDVRVIAATHQDLRARVADGRFREDLLFRLDVLQLAVPALRQRKEDISELAHMFLHEACERMQKPDIVIAADALAHLIAYAWPGNVRELANVMERAAVLDTSGEVNIQDLPSHIVSDSLKTMDPQWIQVTGRAVSIPLGTPLREVEDLLIRKTLEVTQGDRQMAAKLLGVHSRTISRKVDSKI